MNKYSINKIFGGLKIVNYISYKNREVICKCGNKYITSITNIGRKRSGCQKCVKPRLAIERFTTHGFTKNHKIDQLYQAWTNIKTRCYNKNVSGYKYYGGKGIMVCDEWRKSFISFRNWSITNGFNRGLTIERIDFNGNYEPKNCSWINKKMQSRNRKGINFFNYNGENLTLGEIAVKIGIKSSTIRQRYYCYKWSFEKIINFKRKRG